MRIQWTLGDFKFSSAAAAVREICHARSVFVTRELRVALHTSFDICVIQKSLGFPFAPNIRML